MMEKLKNLTIFYVFRNGMITFIITLAAFLYPIAQYYQKDITYSFQRIFLDNLYSVLFFGIVWLLNYLLFELYKISLELICHYIDDKEFFSLIKITDIIAILLASLTIVLFTMMGHDGVVELNGILLGIFMFGCVGKRIFMKYKKNKEEQS